MKKNKILLLILITPSLIYSQELEDSYLESLPEGVKSDVLKKIESQDGEESKLKYRRAPSDIDKALVELEKLRMLEELDRLKELRESKQTKEIKRFGNQIFNTMQSSFMPINDPNLDGAYVLDFGDIIELQLVGQKNLIKELKISRDGSINIPEVGKVNLSGLSLESASNLIKAKVSNAYIGTNAYISLTNIRDIQVLISGNSANPGLYTLNGNSNVLNALNVSGGISEDGSFREVQIIRDGRVFESIDLYSIFIYGNSNFGPRLVSGDSVFIKPVQSLVSAVSGVNRPMLYEMMPDETIQDLINFANGFAKEADLDFISIERLNKEKIMLIDLTYDQLAETKVKHGDSLFIKEYLYRKVVINGAVRFPGTYIINEGEKLSSLISRAGGYKDSAYPFASHLNNQRTLELNKIAKEKLYDKFIEDIVISLGGGFGNQGSSSDTLPIILEQLKNTPINGRVMAEFDIDLVTKNPQLDTSLEDGDEILVPYILEQVYVYGDINNPGTVRYEPGKNVNYYIKNAGGVERSADKGNIFVVHPNGKTELAKNNSRLSFLIDENSSRIYPGSIIFVPKDSTVKDSAVIASIWAPIISSLALSVTSLSVLSDNN